MPEIPIDDIESKKTILITQAIMYSCYPDINFINEFNSSFLAKIIKNNGLEIPSEIAGYLVDAPSHSDIIAKTMDRADHAVAAGDILWYLHELKYQGKKNPSLHNAYRELAFSYKKAKKNTQKRNIGCSLTYLKGAWSKYKLISPLWAASRLMEKKGYSQLAWTKNYMVCFFALSEYLADFGENLLSDNRGKQQKEPFFKTGEVWRIPKNLRHVINQK